MSDWAFIVGMPLVFLLFARFVLHAAWESPRHRYGAYFGAFGLLLVGLVSKFEVLVGPALALMFGAWVAIEGFLWRGRRRQRRVK
jgi:hypothetical protein